MIDERKLLEKINDYCSEFDESLEENKSFDGYNIKSICMSVIAEILDLIQDQPKVDEWIPCSERLPEDLMTVNVTWVNRKPQTYYSYIKDKPFVNTALRFNGKWYWWSVVTEDVLREYGESVMDAIDNGIEVIAWQPLPEPYSSGD